MRGRSSAKGYGAGIRAAILSVICAAAGVSGAHATTISWGSLLQSNFRDSNGDALNVVNYTVQIGVFENFTPDDTNVAQWASRWRVFDQATLNLGLNPETNDHFASNAELSASGTSNSPFAARNPDGTGVYDFRSQTAYIWIRNSTNPVPGTEWFLATAGPAWIFPPGIDDCCVTDDFLQWSVSDLYDSSPAPGTTPVTPVWGSQSNPLTGVGASGSGVYTVPNSGFDLQTYTFVPEPSSLLLTLTGSCLLLIRRRPAA